MDKFEEYSLEQTEDLFCTAIKGYNLSEIIIYGSAFKKQLKMTYTGHPFFQSSKKIHNILVQQIKSHYYEPFIHILRENDDINIKHLMDFYLSANWPYCLMEYILEDGDEIIWDFIWTHFFKLKNIDEEAIRAFKHHLKQSGNKYFEVKKDEICLTNRK